MQNYLNIDLDFFQQQKVQKLENYLGKEAVGFYLELKLRLASAKDYRLPIDYEILSYYSHLTVSFIRSVIEDYDLFIIEDVQLFDSTGFCVKSVPYFWCEDVVEKMTEINNDII